MQSCDMSMQIIQPVSSCLHSFMHLSLASASLFPLWMITSAHLSCPLQYVHCHRARHASEFHCQKVHEGARRHGSVLCIACCISRGHAYTHVSLSGLQRLRAATSFNFIHLMEGRVELLSHRMHPSNVYHLRAISSFIEQLDLQLICWTVEWGMFKWRTWLSDCKSFSL